MNNKIDTLFILGAVIFVSLLSANHVRAATNKEFTIGTYYFLPNFLTLESRYEELRKGGFDLIIADQLVPGYFTPGPGAVAEIESICDNVLSAGDKYGIQVMFQPSGFFLDEDNTGFWNLYSAWRLPDYREAIKKAFQNCAPRHNSFWGFFTQDEANYEWRFDTYLKTMKSGFEEIMAALPSAHVFQNFGPHGDVDYLRSWIAADTIGSDPYPISTYEDPCGTSDRLVLQNDKYVTNYFYNGLPAGTPCDVNVVGAFTKNMVDAAQGKPVWMTLQAFDMKRYFPSLLGKNTPDYADLHAMAYSAITHGANGIMWYGLIPQFPDLTTDSQIYKDVVKVNLELQSIKPILSSPTASNFTINNSANIDQIVKTYNNDKYAILLNRQDASTAYVMNTQSVSALQVQNVLTGSNIPITNGQFSDTIEPHGVRVYKIQASTNSSSVQNVSWANAVGVSVPGNNLTKTSADGRWDAGTSSVQSIPIGDGYVEFSSNEANKHKMGGLSNSDTDQNFTDIDFAIFLTADSNVYIYERGTCNYGAVGAGCSMQVNTSYVAGDIFRVAVESGKVKYYKNGTLLYTNNDPMIVYPLLFDTSLFSAGATISNAKIASIPTPTPVISNVTAFNIGQFNADISWSTVQLTDGQVEFLNPCPATGCLTPIVSTLSTSHLINIFNLLPNTIYPYHVKSRNASGILATSSNFSFTTQSTPTPAPNPTPVPTPSSGERGYSPSAGSTGSPQATPFPIPTPAPVLTKAPPVPISSPIFRPQVISPRILKFSTNPQVYILLSNNMLKWIPNPEVFNFLGLDWKKIEQRSLSDKKLYKRASLLRARNDPKVYYITEAGKKRWIPTVEVFNSYNNRWEDILEVERIEIDSISDVQLIRKINDKKVYKLENGQKRWIETYEAFVRDGFKMEDVAPVNDLELNTWPEGERIR